VAIVAMPDEYLGEKSCAFVILKDEKIKKRELKAFLRERGLASYKIPDRIEWVDAFPKTHLGKVSKKDLRKYIQEKLNDQKSKVSVKG
jgi:Peptide arylation enzymes